MKFEFLKKYDFWLGVSMGAVGFFLACIIGAVAIKILFHYFGLTGLFSFL